MSQADSLLQESVNVWLQMQVISDQLFTVHRPTLQRDDIGPICQPFRIELANSAFHELMGFPTAGRSAARLVGTLGRMERSWKPRISRRNASNGLSTEAEVRLDRNQAPRRTCCW